MERVSILEIAAILTAKSKLKKKDAEFLANVNLLGDGPQVVTLASNAEKGGKYGVV